MSYSLTNPQNSIWLTEKFYTGTSVNNICGYVYISDSVDFNALKKAINELVKTNDNMRLKFKEENNSCIQYLSEYKAFDIDMIDFSSEKDIEKKALEMANIPFEIKDNLLFKFILFRLPNGAGGFIVNVHHIISDSWTLGLVAKEVTGIYSEILNSTYEEKDFPSYVNYINNEISYIKSDKFNKDKEYWNNVFKTVPEVASIPSYKKINSSNISCKGSREKFNISQDDVEKIKSFCKEHKISLYNFFMSVYSLYVGRVSNLDNFVIGTPILNRTNFEQKHTMGMFISTAPLRINLDHNISFVDFSKQIATDTMSILRHQKYPYQYILEDLRKKDSSIPNLYNVILSYQITKTIEESSSVKYTTDWVFNGNCADDLQIHLFDLNDENSITVAYDYKSDKYDTRDITDLHNRILTMIKQIIDNNKILLKDIEIVTPEEKHKILYEFNNTKVDYPKDKTIVDLFEEQVEKTPDNIAVVFEDQKLTYRELNEKANQLANYLLDNKVSNRDVVALLLDKSLEVIISILATLKVGATYLPLDVDYPQHRLDYILDNSNAKIILTTHNEKKIDSALPITYVDCDSSIYTNSSSFKTNTNIRPSDLAYITYTSGSTGNPKGVMIQHKNVVRLVQNTNFITFSPNDRILQTGSIVFDASTFEIFGALLNGLRVYIMKKENLLNPDLFADYIINNKITTLFLTTALFNKFCEANPKMFNNLKYLLTGGEAVSNKHMKIAKIANPNLELVHVYGPTENTTFSTYYPVTNDLSNFPIGKPISNSTGYVVNQYGNLCPIGVPGELWVGGDGVAKGYLNNKDLTNDKFIPNPFDDGIIYKTGDLVKWLPDGNIEFIGRIDNQVKVRGFRIELSEIDNNILTYPNIKQAISIIHDINNSKFICSYIVAEQNIDTKKLKEYLSKTLANYMIPTYIMQLDKLPLNINGKVDRKLLPMPSNINKSNNILPARNDIDKIILSTLKDLFNLKNVSIDDNLFDLGIDSLSSITLSNNISNKLKVQLTVKDIFNNPTIERLSDYISTLSEKRSLNTIQKAEKMEYYPLSSAQKRMYYSSSLDNNSTLYNIAGGIIVDKLLDVNKLQECFNILINRHEALRTHFDIVNDEVVQVIDDNINFKLSIENTSSDDLNKIYSDFVKPFDLSKAPLFRAKLVKLDNDKMLILLDMHHIISDGTSLSILLQELCELYNGSTLPDNQIDYKDFTLWEKEQFEKDEFKKSREYWVNQFKDEIPLLNMPTNYPRPSVQSFEGSNYHTKLSKEVFDKVNKVAKELNITPYMLMLSVYYILLSKYTSQDDIVVGTPIVGRELPELSNVLGMFVNTLALRNKIDHTLTFEEFTKSIKENCLNSFKNQSYPFDMLVKDLNVKRDTSRNPLFDVMFVYQNNGYPKINFKDANAEYFVPDNNIAKFDLTLEIIPIDDEYSLRFEYCTKLFNEDFIKRLSIHYINILNAILENNEIKIADIDMLSKEERNQILYEFNNIEEETNNDTFVSLFEKQVEKYPNNIALICDNKSLTYLELNKKANSLAHFLISHNVKQNDIVAVMTDRSLETIVCMLGILKAGAAFVNMDPTYPIERTTYYLNDCKAKCVLKQKHLELPINNFKDVFEIDLNITDIYDKNTNNPNININLQSLSYIIYTSGSTGTPKGVVLNHIGLANMCKAMTLVLDYLKDAPNHTLLSVTSTPFDIFVYEIVVPLSHGMKIVLANNAEHRNPKLVDELIRKYNVDVMTVTPSLMKINYDNREPDSALANVKNMVFGGEPLSEKFVNDLKALSSDITIYNIYGPSEITVLSNVQNLNGEKKITVGPPILNTKIYVLDNDMNPLPIGLPGEIYIGGIQVGCGYLGKEDLTKEKFIKNPFTEGRMFKSGDIGRWTEDGKLQCLGRIDHQVKLRGLRIELGEIEKILESIPEVDEAVVNKVIVNEKEALCAYYVLNSDIDESLLRTTLREKLPYYMVPTYFMRLDCMPYSINRKIDRKALPIPNTNNINLKRSVINSDNLSPNAQKLLYIWKNVLNNSDINIEDNFFDIGGDSISAIQVQIEAVKAGINIEYSDIFKYPTIKQLAGNLKKDECFDVLPYTNDKINQLLKNNTDSSLSTIHKAKIRNILVIGTTGYLGVHLIHEFLTKHSGNVYCLIRPKNRIEPHQRLEDIFTFYFGKKCFKKYKNRMVIVKGDITMENMGMSQEDIDIVNNKVDAVINSGALVKHYGESKLFEDINVLGTQNIVDFCTKYKKRLLHISTISVSGNGEKLHKQEENALTNKVFSEQDLYIGQQISGIYTYTKFKAESIVLNATLNGLDAMILRIGNITNRYSDGIFQRNYKDNAFAQKIKSFIEIGAFPEYFLEHKLELTPVDLCAEAIIKILYYNSNCNVLHISNNNLLPIKLFADVVQDFGITLNPVSNKAMSEIITRILEDNDKKNIISGIIYDLDNNKNLIYTSNISLNSDFSNKYLSKIGFSWKKINKNYLKRCLKYFNKIGFINF